MLFYAKSRTYFFNPYRTLSDQEIDEKFNRTDEKGERYYDDSSHIFRPMGLGLRPNLCFEWRGFKNKTPAGWVLSKDRLEEEYQKGNIVIRSDGRLERRKYLRDFVGVNLSNFWEDIPPAQGDEKLGYPTQKPEALLERIIKASSNEGDTVLDAYCGCGTTVAVAQRLNRRWIGIDITYQSIALILKRLADRYPDEWPAIEANILLDGVPRDLESAMALANRKDDKTRKEFEKWAILTFSRNQARINEKKGADGGIDGIAYFLLDSDANGKAIFQVKSRPGTRADLATLNSDRLREKAEFGFLICTGLPTKPMRDEIAAAGKFKHPLLNREDDRLQVVTVAELFDSPARLGVRLDLPMGRKDAVKSAAAKGDGDKQIGLDL